MIGHKINVHNINVFVCQTCVLYDKNDCFGRLLLSLATVHDSGSFSALNNFCLFEFK